MFLLLRLVTPFQTLFCIKASIALVAQAWVPLGLEPPSAATARLGVLLGPTPHHTRRGAHQCLDPGSGRKIPAIWHGTGAYHDCYPKNVAQKTV